jgi:hypothetical protein
MTLKLVQLCRNAKYEQLMARSCVCSLHGSRFEGKRELHLKSTNEKQARELSTRRSLHKQDPHVIMLSYIEPELC